MFGYGQSHITSHDGRRAQSPEGRRVKTVHESRMVAHLWAHQRQDFARNGTGNFYFEGPAIYSYGSHYVAGYMLPDGVALINNEKHSVTTSAHVSDVRSAAPGASYYIPALTDLVRRCTSQDGKTVFDLGRTLAFIQEHGVDGPAGLCLLRHAGLAPGAQSERVLARAIKTRDSRIAREKAADSAANKRANLKAAKAICAQDESDFQARLKAAKTSWELNRAKEQSRAAHKAAKAAGYVKQAAKVWERLKAIRARMAQLDAAAGIIERNRYMHTCVAALRGARRPGNTPESAYNWRELGKKAGFIADYAKAIGGRKSEAWKALCVALHSVADHVQVGEHERELAKQAAKVAAWREGGPAVYISDSRGGALLRAVHVTRDESGNISGGTLQTSRGADVPLVHAIKAFRFLKLCHETGRTWEANGRTIRVGHFQIERVTPESFKAGCHLINWPEVEALAKRLGVFEVPADESPLESRS